ncbi:MAG: alpha-(1-_3)-arabinofuranosyltransferase family protein [Patescibacteria group bacterium]
MTKLKKLWWLALLPLIGLPWLWLRPGELIHFVDFSFPLSGALAFGRSLFSWDQIDNLGCLFGAQFYPPRLLIHGFIYLTELTQLNPQKLWLGLSLFAPALTMGLLVSELLHGLDEKKRRLAAIVGGFFAALNLYLLVQILDLAMVLQLVFVPLVLYLSFKAARTGDYWRYGLLTALVSPGLAILNPSSSATGLFIIALSIGRGVLRKYQRKQKQELVNFLRYIAIALVGAILINIWWFVPFISTLGSITSSVEIPTTDWLSGTSAGTSLWNVARLVGAWDWFSTFNGEPYVPYASRYLGLGIVGAVALVPAVLALIGYLKRPTRSFNFFAMIALAGILLAAGAHGITGRVFKMLYQYVPGFWLFRSPWYKFSLWIVIGFAPLIGWVCIWLADRFKLKPILVAATAVLLFGIIAHPLVTGERFTKPSPNRSLAVNRLTIPSYINETADFLNAQQDQGRLLMLPQIFHDTTKYRWGYGSLKSPLYDLLENRAMVYRTLGQELDYTPLLNRLRDSLRARDKQAARQVIDLMGVRYVLHQRDFDLEFFKNDPSADDLERYVILLGGELTHQSGEWLVYDLGETKLAEGLTGVVVADRFENLFNQEFPKDTALTNLAPSELKPSQTGGMIRLTLDDLRKEDGLLKTTVRAPVVGSYRIGGNVVPNLTINGQLLTKGATVELKEDNEFALEPGEKLPLTNLDFKNGLNGWLVQNLALNPDKSIKRGVVPVAAEHGDAAELRAVDDWVALNRDLPPLSVHAVVISFDLDQVSGQFEVAIDQPKNHKSFPVLVDSMPKKRHYDLIVYGEIFNTPTQLYFYLGPNEGEGLARVSNVTIYPVKNPVEVLLNKPPEGFTKADFRYDRPSPTTINLKTETSGPFLIHVKEHYDPRWILRGHGFTAKPIKINNATMAFVVDRGDLKEFSLELSLTKNYRAAMAVSFAAVVFILAALAQRHYNRR